MLLGDAFSRYFGAVVAVDPIWPLGEDLALIRPHDFRLVQSCSEDFQRRWISAKLLYGR